MTAATIISDRMYRSVLSLEVQNINGDIAQAVELPTGFGDCFIHDVAVDVTSIATILASAQNFGVSLPILHTASSAYVDYHGVTEWKVESLTRLAAFVNSERGTLWRTGESLFVIFQEVDTNASPTADLTILIRVTRLRSS